MGRIRCVFGIIVLGLLFGCMKSSKGGRADFQQDPPPPAVPVITNVTSSSADGGYDLASIIPIQITFSIAVNVTGTPRLTLETGDTDTEAEYVSGSGTNVLVFQYTVSSTDIATDLDYASTTALNLSGGSIVSVAQGEAANLTLPNVGAATSLGGSKSIVIGAVWNFVDGDNDTAGINYNNGRTALWPVLASANSTLFALWQEPNVTTTQVRASFFNGTTWAPIDGGSTDGLNRNPLLSASRPAAISLGTALYAAWAEENATAVQVRVARYQGSTWSFIDGNNTDGLNKDPSQDADAPSVAVMGSDLYVAWHEDNAAGYSNIRVIRYNSVDGWDFVDGDGANGLNQNTGQDASEVHLTVHNSNLYAAWQEGDPGQIRVKRYNGGSSWSFIDGGGVNGLNRSAALPASSPTILSFSSALYASWTEENVSGDVQVRVARYNGTSWSFVDGNAAEGLNFDDANNANSSTLVIHNSQLYLSWAEGFPAQIRLRKFDGTNWHFVDGDTEAGINKLSVNGGGTPSLLSFGSRLYESWIEATPIGTVRIARYQ